MDVIRKKMIFLAALTILSGVATACLALRDLSAGSVDELAFWVAFFLTSTASCLVICENGRMEEAKLIAENRILHICAAKILDGEKRRRSWGDVEVFVSGFGILLNDKVIKFNQERIQLRSVEIDRDYIELTYGTNRKSRTVRLLHAGMDAGEASRIADAFLYETGIAPAVNVA